MSNICQNKVFQAGTGSAIVIFFTILTIFIIPDISANAESIDELDRKIFERFDRIEEQINHNTAILCYMTEGKYC